MLSAIACVDNNGLLGINGSLPYRFPDDLRLFKKFTIGSTLYCGPNTFKEMGNLKDRKVEVLYGDLSLPEDADGFLVGGAKVFSLHLTACDMVYLSKVKPEYAIDPQKIASERCVYFPMDQLAEHFYQIHAVEYPTFVLQVYAKNNTIIDFVEGLCR